MTLINNMLLNLLGRLHREEEGQGLVEYALIIAGVSIALIAALALLAGDIEGTFTDIGDVLNPG